MSDGKQSVELTNFLAEPIITIANQVELLLQLKKENKLGDTPGYVLPLLETFMFAELSKAELSTFLIAANNSQSQWESRVCYCFCEIEIGEGLLYLSGAKKLWHLKKNPQWSLCKLLQEGKWKKELIDCCEQFTSDFIDNNLLLNLTTDKNISKHFDNDYIEVINHLIAVDSKQNSDRIKKYIELLTNIENYIKKYVDDNNVVIFRDGDCILDYINGYVLPHFNDYSTILEIIRQDEPYLESLIKQKAFKSIITNLRSRTNNKETELLQRDIDTWISIFTPIFHIIYVELCICYALKAYEQSTDYLQKQINQYRVVLAYYEGYKKLYGLSDEEKRPSIMQTLHPYCEQGSPYILQKEYEIICRLESIKDSVMKYDSYRQDTVHNGNGKSIQDKFCSMVQLHPIEFFTDVQKFWDIIRPLRELTALLAEKYLPEYWPK